MPDPFSAEHLNQLRQRWERDPKSRAFLQLAEEYRRAGRLADAVHVLQAGLQEHPNYLSAQVALGRCLMESGAPEPAAAILERAVAKDPTQLVANKLLVEAYLAKGQAAKARERLDLYKLFNDRDAEIEPLENRIRALEGLPPTTAAPKKHPVRESRDTALFNLPGVEALPDLRLENALTPAPSRRDASGAEPFGQVHAPGATARIAEAFAQQGIFAGAQRAVESPLAAAPISLPPVAAVTSAASVQPDDPPPVFDLPADPADPIAPVAPVTPISPFESAPVAAKVAEFASFATPPPEPPAVDAVTAGGEWAPEVVEAPPAIPPAVSTPQPAAVPPPVLPVSEAPRAASSTLGELYLAQGHFAEAEDAFRSVLQSRPGDAAALAGLDSVRQLRGGEAAGFDEEVVDAEESNVIVGGLTARKASLLKDYLARLRQGAKRHVS